MDNYLDQIYSLLLSGVFDYLVGFMLVLFIFSTVVSFVIKTHFNINNNFTKKIKDIANEYFSNRELKKKVAYLDVISEVNNLAYEQHVVKRRSKNNKSGDKWRNIIDFIFHYDRGLEELKDSLVSKQMIYRNGVPDFEDFTDRVFRNCRNWNYMLGFIPNALFIRFVKLLPGLMIIMGILGTFVGMVGALPLLGTLDLNNVDGSQQMIADFLYQVAFAMKSSIVGISFSIFLSIINGMFSTDDKQEETLERYEESLKIMWDWYNTQTNLDIDVTNQNSELQSFSTSLDRQSNALESLVQELKRQKQGI